MDHRTSASFGKREEFIFAGKLLENGFDVYTTLVDDQGIDLVVRLSNALYVEIQVKARSEKALNPEHFGPYPLDTRENFFYYLKSVPMKKEFLIPSEALIPIMTKYKSGVSDGKGAIKIPSTMKSSKAKVLDEFTMEKSLHNPLFG